MSVISFLLLAWASFCFMAAHYFWKRGVKAPAFMIFIGAVGIVVSRLIAALAGTL